MRMTLCVLIYVVGCIAAAEDPVVFPDAHLEAAVRDIFQIPLGRPIYPSDLSDLDRVNFFMALDSQISDLTGMEYVTSLEYVDLSENYVSDLTPLAGLANLRKLDLGDNLISDLTPLAGLVDLTDLDLGDNRISDLTPLKQLVNLERLDLTGNKIQRLIGLPDTTKLQDLSFGKNQIADLSELPSRLELLYLDLSANKIVQTAFPPGLRVSRVLHLEENQITNLAGIESIGPISVLYLYDNQIIELYPLSGIGGVSLLELSRNRVTSLEGLPHFEKGGGTPVESFCYNPYAPVHLVTELYFSDNQITDLDPLVANDSVDQDTRVYLTDNPLSDDAVNHDIPELEKRCVTVEYPGATGGGCYCRFVGCVGKKKCQDASSGGIPEILIAAGFLSVTFSARRALGAARKAGRALALRLAHARRS